MEPNIDKINSSLEFLNVYDAFGEKTGEIVERGVAHKKGILHRVIHLWLINADNEILMQRSYDEDVGGAYWYVSVSGHIISSESVKDTLIRETMEELELDIT